MNKLLYVEYFTSEHVPVGSGYTLVSKWVWLEPIRIYRRHYCDRGRYEYHGVFNAPDDAEFVVEGRMSCRILRKHNPRFKPAELEFVKNVWVNPLHSEN